MSKKPKKTPDYIDPRTVKVRKRIAPGVRVIKSAKDKERKHPYSWNDTIRELYGEDDDE